MRILWLRWMWWSSSRSIGWGIWPWGYCGRSRIGSLSLSIWRRRRAPIRWLTNICSTISLPGGSLWLFRAWLRWSVRAMQSSSRISKRKSSVSFARWCWIELTMMTSISTNRNWWISCSAFWSTTRGIGISAWGCVGSLKYLWLRLQAWIRNSFSSIVGI